MSRAPEERPTYLLLMAVGVIPIFGGGTGFTIGLLMVLLGTVGLALDTWARRHPQPTARTIKTR